MRSALVAFAVSVGILIIAVSTWVVLRARDAGGDQVAFTQASESERSFFDVLTFADPLAQNDTPTATTPTTTTTPSPLVDAEKNPAEEVTPATETSTPAGGTTDETIAAAEPPFWQRWLAVVTDWIGGISETVGTQIAAVETEPTTPTTPTVDASPVEPTTPAEEPVTAMPTPIENEQPATSAEVASTATTPVEQAPTVTKSTSFLDRFTGGDALSFDERMTRGEAALAAGDFPTAVTEFAAAAQRKTDSVDALLRLAEAQFYNKSYEQALGNLDAVERLDATNPSIFILRGRIAIRTGRFQPAIEHFLKGGAKAAFWQGVMAAFYDRADDAKTIFQKLADAGGGQAAQANAFLAAYAEYAKFPDSPKTHLDTLLARVFTQIGEFELASAKLTPVVAGKPDYVSAWVLLGYAELHRENFDGARQALETAYRLDGSDPQTQYLLGATYIQLKKYAQAERYLLLARDNQYADTYELARTLGDLYYAVGKFSEAAMSYGAMVQSGNPLASDFVRPTYLYLEKLSNGTAAWQIAKLAMAKHPESAMSWNLAGWVSTANGYTTEAAGYLEKAQSIDPQLPAVHLNFGKLYEKTSDLEKAKAAYKKAYELDQNGSIGQQAGAAYNRLIGQ